MAAALDATIHASRRNGSRVLPMREFPAFYMTPAIEPDEIVTAVAFEPWPAGHGYAFVEFARRLGDFAVAGVAVLLDAGGDGCHSTGFDRARRDRGRADTLPGGRSGAHWNGAGRRAVRRGLPASAARSRRWRTCTHRQPIAVIWPGC